MSEQRWHIGQNMPGYMPNESPYCMTGMEAEAAAAARSEAENALESCDGDCCTADCECECDCLACLNRGQYDPHCLSCETPCSHHVGELDDSGDYWLDETDCELIGSGGLHVWYAPCDEPAECEREDHEQRDCSDGCSICAAEDA